MNGLALPDADDHHVLAAALAAEAETILTMNLRDFPASALAPYGVVAVHPDEFLCGLHDADPDLLRASTAAAHANLSRSAPSLAAYLDVLERQGLPQLTRRLRMWLINAGSAASTGWPEPEWQLSRRQIAKPDIHAGVAIGISWLKGQVRKVGLSMAQLR